MPIRSLSRTFAVATIVLPLAACQPDGSPPVAGVATHGLLAPTAPLRARVAAAGGSVSSVDERGVPTFVWSTTRMPPPAGASREDAARFHARRHAATLGISADAVGELEVVNQHDRGADGLVTRLRQRRDGLEVYRSELRVLMRPDLSLIAISGQLHATGGHLVRGAFARSADEAIAATIERVVGTPVTRTALVLDEADGEDLRYRLADGAAVALPDGARARKVLFPDGDRLRPAWLVDVYAGPVGAATTQGWTYLLAADDLAVLDRRNLTASDGFSYRVWADASNLHTPLDGPLADYTPYPATLMNLGPPPFIPSGMVTMNGFNRHGMGDPWLPADAVDTRGNNIDAYLDRNPPDGFSSRDFRAHVTSPGTFDIPYDVTRPSDDSDEQAAAAIVQAFYVTNWLHDYFYDSGFNEKAGNAQQSNLSRGGKAADRMRVETQDFSGRNNSNMTTPPDGYPPRMQLYVWDGLQSISVKLASPSLTMSGSGAVFGPQVFELDGPLVEADDGSAPVTDACEPIANVAGKIVIIDRGTCTFKLKALNAQNAGAIGVILVNNIPGTPPSMGDGDPMDAMINIPILSISINSGTKLRNRLGGNEVDAHISRSHDVDRDGALENLVIAHEWGHYLHHRLADCASHQCDAISEGWGDFDALMMMLREGDDVDGTFASALYCTGAIAAGSYYGIRRQPYSVDFTRNGLTFQDISDGVILPKTWPRSGSAGGPNSEVHNAGEVWATMMFEAYVALQKAGYFAEPSVPFDVIHRRMADYVVAGLEMMPQDATYTESRDAILAAAIAHSTDDGTTLAEAFARRGAGTCASSPARDSQNLVGVVESYGVQPRIEVGAVTLTDAPKTCDSDGVLDAGERAQLTIEIANGALFDLDGAHVEVSTKTAGIAFTGPTGFNLPTVPALTTTKIVTEVTLDPARDQVDTLVLDVVASAPGSCAGGERTVTWKINYDEAPASSATDDVEAGTAPWKTTGDVPGDVWSRDEAEKGNHVWHGLDLALLSDTSLESPDLVVSQGTPFVIDFDHRHSFEAATVNGKRVFFDGAVVEISDDAGATWKDVSTWADPGYADVITDQSGNPLGKRRAFVDRNNFWPNRDHISIKLGNNFAGKTVRVRFRIGTDEMAGDFGWELDNLAFSGIDNQPFTGVVVDAGHCGTGSRGGVSGGGCHLAQRDAPAGLAALLLASLALLGLRRRRAR